MILWKKTEYEIGLVIHGEKGKERIEFKSTDEIIKNMFENCFAKNIMQKTYEEMTDIIIVIQYFVYKILKTKISFFMIRIVYLLFIYYKNI